jgi:hypothetical protein
MIGAEKHRLHPANHQPFSQTVEPPVDGGMWGEGTVPPVRAGRIGSGDPSFHVYHRVRRPLRRYTSGETKEM